MRGDFHSLVGGAGFMPAMPAHVELAGVKPAPPSEKPSARCHQSEHSLRIARSMKPRTLLFFAAVAGAALAVPVLATAATEAPPVVAVSSSTIAVHRPELRPAAEGWLLAGCVAPQHGTWPQATTHLDIVFLDVAGAELTVRTEPLAATTLRERPRRPRPHARYELALGELPVGTARIEVRAHDGAVSKP